MTHTPTPEQQAMIDAGGCVAIELTQGLFTIVDIEDLEMLMTINTKWFAHKCRRTFYAETKVSGKVIKMHRAIMKPEWHLEVDHNDRDGLNNRRSNLEIMTQAENKKNKRTYGNNKSGVPGVFFGYWGRSAKPWHAQITRDGIQKSLGHFKTKEEAIKARLEAEHAYANR